jgi:hypothetical protein
MVTMRYKGEGGRALEFSFILKPEEAKLQSKLLRLQPNNKKLYAALYLTRQAALFSPVEMTPGDF